MTPVITITIGIVFAVALALAVYFFFRKTKFKELDQALLLIELPKNEEEKGNGDFKKDINLSEQLFSSLLSLEEPFTFEVAVKNDSPVIRFFVSVPRNRAEFVQRQIQGLFLEAKVEQVADYNIFSPHGYSVAGYLSLGESYILPLRTYEESEIDTFAQILSNLSTLSETGEGAAIQIMVRPSAPVAKKNILGALVRLKKGEKLSKILKQSFISADDLKDVVVGSGKKDSNEPKVIDELAVEAVNKKLSKPLIRVNARIVASGQTPDQASDIFMSLAGSYAQLSAPMRNEIKVVKVKKPKDIFYKFAFRIFDPKTALVLNGEELASIFHLPTLTSDIPRVKWLDSKESAPPENLPDKGIVIGETIFRDEKTPVHIDRNDRMRHIYMIGQTGTGKSGEMVNMVVQDMQLGNGICVIDPNGDLVGDILERVPENRIEDVIVFDPGDVERPLGLNMLEYDLSKPEQKSFIVNEVQTIFNKLFEKQPEGLGPMFQQYMRNTLLLLMEDYENEPATFVEVPRVLTDTAWRKAKLARIDNPLVVDFWEKEASKVSGEASLANMAPYITTKFGNFISNDYVRPIIGQPKSTLNFREIMDDKKILLVDLAKGKIGDINAYLLGMVITGKILMAALGRASLDKKDRTDFYFYIDEFQNVTTDSIATIFAEARKYSLSLTVAHQYIQQLPDNIREAVFGNVGTLIAFRVGVPDAEVLVKQFAPEYDEKDLISSKMRTAIMRMLINGHPSEPFTMRTIDYIPGNNVLKEKLKELSRLTYGKERAIVEREIYNRLRY